MARSFVTAATTIKNILKKSKLVVNCYEKTSTQFRTFLYTLSPRLLATYIFLKTRRRMPDLKNPKSFDEKLIWLMLYWRHPLKSHCADKYTMRSYVKEHGFGHILPELLGIYDNYGEIDFANLPEQFVLKCTHGCGFNIICKDKSKLDLDDTKDKLSAWMKTDISKVAGEIHYAQIKPRIICERFLDDLSGGVPADYKVYCFGGKAHCTMACTTRSINGRAKYDFYDREWMNKLPYSKSSLLAIRSISKPEAYEEIIEAAERLSKPFPFVRMDFYSINGKAILGEMTFTPAGCIDPGYTEVAQYELGKMIRLPAPFI